MRRMFPNNSALNALEWKRCAQRKRRKWPRKRVGSKSPQSEPNGEKHLSDSAAEEERKKQADRDNAAAILKDAVVD